MNLLRLMNLHWHIIITQSTYFTIWFTLGIACCMCSLSRVWLCDPMDWGTDSSVRGIFPGKNTGVGCHLLLQGSSNLCYLSLLHCKQTLYHCASHVQLFATPWTVAHQAPLSMGFSRQEYWSGLPFPSPGDLPNPGIEPGSLHCRQMLYPLSHQGSPVYSMNIWQLYINMYLLL